MLSQLALFYCTVYGDVKRGILKGHLTVTQFKVAQELRRLPVRSALKPFSARYGIGIRDFLRAAFRHLDIFHRHPGGRDVHAEIPGRGQEGAAFVAEFARVSSPEYTDLKSPAGIDPLK